MSQTLPPALRAMAKRALTQIIASGSSSPPPTPPSSPSSVPRKRVTRARACRDASTLSSTQAHVAPLMPTVSDLQDGVGPVEKSAVVKQEDGVPLASEDADGEYAEEETPKKKKRKTKPKEPIVYVIPPVESRETTFKGRLGYACLNTILRTQKPPVFCSRTCRIDTIKKEGMEYLKELGRLNMADLTKLIEWNAARHIFFMRMSSEMFPFAAHEEYQYSLEYAAKELKEAGDTAKRLGVRLTTHPGQFTQLGSPRPVVVENAFRDLIYHNEMMERMGLDKHSVMIIHGGGVYGDKEAALARFKENFIRLPQNVRDRLVLENDELCYNADDLLPVCEELKIPFVFDYHHDWIFPSSKTAAEMMPRILATWDARGIKPKQHLSEPRRGAETIMEKRAHADRCQRLPEALPDDIDLMIEAKDKEQAVLHLFRIYNLYPTEHDDLRPPAEEETTQTAGRKSHAKSKAKKMKEEAEALVNEEGEDLVAQEEEEATVANEQSTPKAIRKAKRVKLDPDVDGALEADGDEKKPVVKEKKVRKPRVKKEKKVEVAKADGIVDSLVLGAAAAAGAL